MMNRLQELVAQRMHDLDLTYRKAAARSDGRVSHATLNAIVTGRHTWRLDDRTVVGIAAALDVGEQAVRDAAADALGQPEPIEHFELPPRADRLSARERRAVIAMVDALLTAAEGQPPRERETDHDGGEPPRRRRDDDERRQRERRRTQTA